MVTSWCIFTILQHIKVKRFFHFCPCLLCFVYFSRFSLCQVQNLHDCRRALQRINNSLGRWAHSGFLPNWLPFFLHACSRGIYYPFALVPIYNFNAFGPFAFLPARVNMHGFAWFFLKEQFIFLNGGDPDILHAWLDAYIALRFNSARLVPQFFIFYENLPLICTYRGAIATLL